MEILLWEQNKHVQINDYHEDNIEVFRLFWSDLQNKHRGFTVDFCYHNCYVPVDFMTEINADVLESCIETRLSSEIFIPINNNDYVIITADNFEEFAKVHDDVHPPDGDMYWTSERIAEDLSKWLIYMNGDNYVLMHLGDGIAEIYTYNVLEKSVGTALISKAAERAFNIGKTGVLCMVDDDRQGEIDMLRKVGFTACGTYVAYRAKTNA